MHLNKSHSFSYAATLLLSWGVFATSSIQAAAKAKNATAKTKAESALLSSHGLTGQTGLISGFDDVLRQAEVQNLPKAATRFFSEDEGFAGMSTLYQAMTTTSEKSQDVDSKAPSFTVVSAMTTMYSDSAEELLKKELYPPFELRFRSWITEWSIEAFKMREIERVLSQQAEKKFVFVFDNSNPSLAIAEKIQQKHGSQTAGIYLRQTLEKPTAPGTKSFVTALDIAAEEHAALRMTSSQVNAVAEAILREKNFDRIIPKFAYCPQAYSPCASSAYELQRKCTLVAKKITDACSRRILAEN